MSNLIITATNNDEIYFQTSEATIFKPVLMVEYFTPLLQEVQS